MEKVTVLTAVYNAEKYLEQCLDSLVSQTLTDCQFICIDDCSTDNSLSILKKYAKQDPRFLVVEMDKNQGQAIARNEGLKHATGEYVAMLDADDWFAPDTLECAYCALKAESADCAVLRLMQCYDDRVEEFPIRDNAPEWAGKDAFALSLDWSIHGLYVVKTCIHKQYPFDTSCKLYSDDNTTRLHYLHSNKVVRCEGQYFYRKHSESMTNACTVRRFDYMLANLSMRHQLEREMAEGNGDVCQDTMRFYEKHRWLNVVGCYWYYYQHQAQFTEDEKKEIRDVFDRILPTIEADILPLSLKMKIGYYPFKSYPVFAFVENFYFRLRALCRRGKEK